MADDTESESESTGSSGTLEAEPEPEEFDPIDAILANITHMAGLFNSYYVNYMEEGWATEAPRQHPRRFMFPTSTFAAGLWEAPEDIHLVCMTEDRRKIFREIVLEQLKIDAKDAPPVKNGTMKLEWSFMGIEGEGAAWLEGTGLYLHWCSVSENFDLALVPAYGFPEDPNPIPDYMRQHVNMVRQAVELNTALDNPPFTELEPTFLACFARIHHWVWAMGLRGRPMGLLEGNTVLNLSFGVCKRWIESGEGKQPGAHFLGKFLLDGGAFIAAYKSALGANASCVTALEQAFAYTGRKITEGGGGGGRAIAFTGIGDLSMKQSEGFICFLESHEHFICFSAECWDNTPIAEFFETRCMSLLRKLARHLTSHAGRIWPATFVTGGVLMCVLGINARILKKAFEELEGWMQEQNRKMATTAGSTVTGSTVTITQEGRKKVEKMFGKTMQEYEELDLAELGGEKGAVTRGAVEEDVLEKGAVENDAVVKDVVEKDAVKKAPFPYGPPEKGAAETDSTKKQVPEVDTPKTDKRQERLAKMKARRKGAPWAAALGAMAKQRTVKRSIAVRELDNHNTVEVRIAKLESIKTYIEKSDIAKKALNKAAAAKAATSKTDPLKTEPPDSTAAKTSTAKQDLALDTTLPHRPAEDSTPIDSARTNSVAEAEASTPKLRPASEALNRLRWDPAHRGRAYEVGYLDRFEGLKWMMLEKWGGKATEEEDFIPEHRVKQIRRKWDRFVVWDRDTRVDRTGENDR